MLTCCLRECALLPAGMDGGMPGFAAPVASKYPPKPKIKTNVPMRPFHWVTVPVRNLDNTLWKEVNEKGALRAACRAHSCCVCCVGYDCLQR